MLASRHHTHTATLPPSHEDSAIGLPAAQVQEFARLAKTVGGARRCHALLLQGVARGPATRLPASARVQRGGARRRRQHPQGVRVQVGIQESRVLLPRRQRLLLPAVDGGAARGDGKHHKQLTPNYYLYTSIT